MLPENTVKKTIKASKDLYSESKLKRSGGEKRLFSSEVPIAKYDSKTEAEGVCFDGLIQRITNVSSAKSPKIIKESASIVQADTLKCEIEAFIWAS